MHNWLSWKEWSVLEPRIGDGDFAKEWWQCSKCSIFKHIERQLCGFYTNAKRSSTYVQLEFETCETDCEQIKLRKLLL